MKISDFLSPDDILVTDAVDSKRQILKDMAEQAAKTSEVDAGTLFEVVLERENLGTGKQAFGERKQLRKGVDFGAEDKQPVDLVFMLLSPENSGADHLNALARISEVMKNQTTCAKLRKASTPADIYGILAK